MSFWAAAADKASDHLLGRSNTRYGYTKDYQYGGKTLRRNWRFAHQLGLTPQEFYGAGAPGGDSSSSGNIMGNAHKKGAIGDAVIAEKQMQTQLEVAETQKESAENVARIQTGQQQKDLDLKVDQYENVTKPQAAKQLRLTEAQINKALNEVTTSKPSFLRAMKLLGMGTDNMAVTVVLEKFGIKDPDELSKLSQAEKAKLLSEMLAAGGHTRKELEGLRQLLTDYLTIPERQPIPHLGNQNPPGRKTYVDQPWLKIYKD